MQRFVTPLWLPRVTEIYFDRDILAQMLVRHAQSIDPWGAKSIPERKSR